MTRLPDLRVIPAARFDPARKRIQPQMRRCLPMFEVLAHTISDTVKITGIGRSSIYEAIGAGKLDARKAGNRTLITAESLRSFLASLPVANITTGRKAAA